MKRKYGQLSTRELAEKGFFKPALSSAVYGDDWEAESQAVLAVYNLKTERQVASVGELKKLFGVQNEAQGIEKTLIV